MVMAGRSPNPSPAPGMAAARFLPRRRVVVAGGGLATAAGGDDGTLLRRLRRRGAGDGRPPRRRRVPEKLLYRTAGARPGELRKLDRFSLLALAASRQALAEAELQGEEIRRCGLLVGNMMAGWSFTEPQLRALHERGPEEVSPYLATAWFPAAPQGEVSIRLDLRGYSKTLTTDRCAAGQAIGMALRRISAGRSDLLLAGGVEAPVTPLVEAAAAALPGGPGWLAEAAGFLLLRAQARGGTRVAAYRSFALSASSRPSQLAAELDPILGGEIRRPLLAVLCNVPPDGRLEGYAREAVERSLDGAPEVLLPTRLFGESLAASTALSTVLAHRLLAEAATSGTVLILSLGHQCGDLLRLDREGDGGGNGPSKPETKGGESCPQ